MAQRVGRGIALLFHHWGTRRGWVVSSTPRPHFTPGKDPVPILQEAGWAPGPVWTGRKSRPHWDSIPDRPPHSSVPILTELPSPLHGMVFHWKYCLYIKYIFQYLGFPFEDSICWRFCNKNSISHLDLQISVFLSLFAHHTANCYAFIIRFCNLSHSNKCWKYTKG